MLVIPKTLYAETKKIDDYGIISIMYHRFGESKYPSTNIAVTDFKSHLELIKNQNIDFLNVEIFEKGINSKTDGPKILLTIDDGFLSFYENAWPILKENKIPFILFVSTREVGKFNYMTWDQIREIAKEDFVHIGNHSHTHEYLIDLSSDQIKDDIMQSIKIFKKELGYESKFFSYPFGEYSLELKRIVKTLGFKFAFGQHSGVINSSHDFLELPRFPINEKYGKIKRFKTIIKTLPLKYIELLPDEKYINNSTNPPVVTIEFNDSLKNLHLINCYSNEENTWRKSDIFFIEKRKLQIKLKGKFTTERGRINCSLQEKDNYWRWLGVQFVVKEK